MERKKKIMSFICIESGLVILCTLPLFLLQAEPASLPVVLVAIVFMLLPALTAMLVKWLFHDKGT